MNLQEALAASHAKDANRCDCEYCGRPMADGHDLALFDLCEESHGGERSDLCWTINTDEHCAGLQLIHDCIDELRAIGVSVGCIRSSVERALSRRPHG